MPNWTRRVVFGTPLHLALLVHRADRGGAEEVRRALDGALRAFRDAYTMALDDELKELYSDAGLNWENDIIAYCRIGERSAHTWFVLHQILGQKNVKNYDGSWTEYGSLVGVPVAVGDEPGNA